MKGLKIFFVLILGIMSIRLASATPITSFEGGSTLADNGMTLTQGIASRAEIQLSASLDGTTLMPTNSTHLLKMIAGTSVDIINPAFPNELVTLVSFNSPVIIDKSFLLVDFAFINADSSPGNDRQRIGLNGTLYDITGSLETGWHTTPNTLGWQTLAIHFTNLGSINLSLGCVNDTINAASSRCLWDNFRTADVLPAPLPGNIPIVTLSGNFQTAPIPEPSTYAMILAGLGLLTVMARRRKLKAT